VSHDPHTPIEIIPDEPQYDFVLAPHWILLAPLKHASIRLYLLMRAHINNQRAKTGDQRVWPSQHTLAEMMGLSRADKVWPYLADLQDHGLISTQHTTTGNMRDRNVYRIRMNPPPGWEGHLSTTDFHAAKKSVDNPPPKKAPVGKTAGGAVDPKTGLRRPENRSPVGPKTGPELYELELDESPPPTSSANSPERVAPQPVEEEEVDEDIKTKIDTLPWYGHQPSPTQLRQLARKTKPLLRKGAVWPLLRAALVASTHSGVRDIVAVYLHRLQEIRLEDVSPPPATQGPSQPRRSDKQRRGVSHPAPQDSGPSTGVLDRSALTGHGEWCGQCQRITRRTLDGTQWCPQCSAHAIRGAKVLTG